MLMDENQDLNQLENKLNESSFLANKKRLFIAGGIVLVAMVIILIVSILPSSTNTSTLGPTPTITTVPSEDSASVGEPTQSPDSTPEVIAKTFHDWYISRPNPLKSGEYKARGDITTEYKEVMETYVTRGFTPGRDPVFNCGDSVLPKEVISLTGEYDDTLTQGLVILQEAGTSRNLYQIKLIKTGNDWKVRDVWCAP